MNYIIRIDNFDYEKHSGLFKKIVNNPGIELYVLEDEGKII